MSTHPNIILINCDDMAYADIGCYGSTLNKTPALDQLAAAGIKFTSFYAPAPVCTPSRAGLMTGSYPKRINMHGFEIINHENGEVIAEPGQGGVLFPGQAEGLHPDEDTLARLLQRNGYHCGMIGKWHLGDQPEFHPYNFGFDFWFGLPYSNDMGLQTRKHGRPTTRLPKCPLPLMRNGTICQQQPDQAAITERYTEEAVRFIDEHQEQSFFLYFAHTYVHGPLFAPQAFIDRSDNGVYGACVEEVDWSLQCLVHKLEACGLTENTLIIFTNDNGGCPSGVNEPLRGFKGSTYEGGQRVNCIMKWPQEIPSGQRCDKICSMLDIYATFKDITGDQNHDGITRDSASLLPLMQNQDTDINDYFYYFHVGKLEAIRDQRYKLHLQRRELYDLEIDISESQNIIEDKPEIVEKLEAAAETARAELGDYLSDQAGSGCRPCGRVENPKPLTSFDPEHPYIVALYDTHD